MTKMSFKASFVLLLSALALLSSHATESPAELYWKTKLGNIPMPKVLKDSLHSGGKANFEYLVDQHAQSSAIVSDAEHTINYARTTNLDAQAATISDAEHTVNYAHTTTNLDAQAATISDAEYTVNYARTTNLDAQATTISDAEHTVNYARRTTNLDAQASTISDAEHTVNYARTTNLDAQAATISNVEHTVNYARATNHQDSQNHYMYTIPKDGRVQYFTSDILFLPCSKMKLHFRKIDDGVMFLPSHVAKTIAIAPNKLQKILTILSVNPKSTAAHYIKHTLQVCEEKGVKDELRFCVTSVESMVDNIALHLNSKKNKMVVTTEQEEDILMDYKIHKAKKLGKDDAQSIVCHKLVNPYAVFLCHNIKYTKVYGVSLVSANGKQMKAVAACHEDTSIWDPNHIAFKILKIKPGSKPICHFLSGDVIVWLEN